MDDYMAGLYDHLREQFGPRLDDMAYTRRIADMLDGKVDVNQLIGALIFTVAELERDSLGLAARIALLEGGG